jgi:hypothetical protein
MPSNQTLARIAGLLYLILAVTGGWAQLVVRPRLHVPGDAAATASNIAESATLFRAAFVADIVTNVCFVLVALLLYAVFRTVSPEFALAVVVLNAVAAAIMSVNNLNHLAALLAATGATANDQLVLLFMELHAQGYLVAQIFNGLWLLPLGYLVFTSLHRPLGALLMVGALGYPASSLLTWTVPSAPETVDLVLSVLTAAAELWLVAWLLIKGAKTMHSASRGNGPLPAQSRADSHHDASGQQPRA